MKKKKISLKQQLIIYFFSISFIPLMIFTFIIIFNNFKHTIHQAKADDRQLLVHTATDLKNLIISCSSDIKNILSEKYLLNPPDFKNIMDERLFQIRSKQRIHKLFFSTKLGHVPGNIFILYPEISSVLSQKNFFILPLQDNNIFIDNNKFINDPLILELKRNKDRSMIFGKLQSSRLSVVRKHFVSIAKTMWAL